MPTVNNALGLITDEDLDHLSHDELTAVAKNFSRAYQACLAEKEKQNEQLKQFIRASSFPSSINSFELQPSWIRAEYDSPGDTAFSCFGERSKYRDVLVYDRNGSSLQIQPRETLKGEWATAILLWLLRNGDQGGVIYCRIPTRTASAIHVFVECATTVGDGSSRKFRISTTSQLPAGFVQHCTIHFRRLSWSTRFKLWNGQIKWLFILRNQDTSIDNQCRELREKPLSSPRDL